ncbi:MAG: class I SAM-dependent methyltransferase [Anaerolineae bacterium]|nr:class I SAM-dependent methyltransferase [Anaerolineae bacterium]
MENSKIELKGVQETLLLPLWGRAVETRKEKPLLRDIEAVRIIDSIDCNFDQISSKVNPLSRASWIARSIYFDDKIKNYLEKNPEGTIINIGCGLDTTYERVNNGKAMWYEVDFPEVIEIRRQLINETSQRKFLAYSVFNEEWYSEISDTDNILIMIAGVIYYFTENQAQDLFRTFENKFKKCTIIFDYSSLRGIKIANRKVIEDSGMDEDAYLKWGIDNIKEIEKWSHRIKVVDNMKMFTEHRKKYPVSKRLGMWISDALSVMSLAQITIG